jgi:hypothetical protein
VTYPGGKNGAGALERQALLSAIADIGVSGEGGSGEVELLAIENRAGVNSTARGDLRGCSGGTAGKIRQGK